jgi:hypothetical protein
MGIERYVRIESEGGTRRMRVVDPATGAAIPGVCNVTLRIRDDSGELLPVPKATIELYCRADVVAALEVLLKGWPGENAVDGLGWSLP